MIIKLKEPDAGAVSAETHERVRMMAVSHRAGVGRDTGQLTAFGARVVRKGQLMRLAEAQALARRIQQDPEVEWAIPNEVERPHALSSAPNDPDYMVRQLWLSDSEMGGLANVPVAWSRFESIGRGAAPIVIAVLDTGVLRHPDLEGRVLFEDGHDFVSELEYANDGDGVDADASDPGSYLTSAMKTSNKVAYEDCGTADSSWHGTIIAGQLAAATDNGEGIAGILRPVSGTVILPVRVSGNCGAAVSDIIEGMLWAAGVSYTGMPPPNKYPARVLNLSFGGNESCACIMENGVPKTAGCLYQEAMRAITRKGAVLVASAGNAVAPGENGKSLAARPANCPGVLGVTSLRSDGLKARYAYLVGSSGIATYGGSGDGFDEGIYSTSNGGLDVPIMGTNGLPHNHYAAKDGTSFASPVAAGAIALMWSINPGLTVSEVLNGLRINGVRPHIMVTELGTPLPLCTTAQTGACNCSTSTCGAGILDVGKAVMWAASQTLKPYSSPDVHADFFTPDHLVVPGVSTKPRSSGGGGALSCVDLCMLMMGGAILIVRNLRRKPH